MGIGVGSGDVLLGDQDRPGGEKRILTGSGVDHQCTQSTCRYLRARCPDLLLNDLSLYCLTPTCCLKTCLCTV